MKHVQQFWTHCLIYRNLMRLFSQVPLLSMLFSLIIKTFLKIYTSHPLDPLQNLTSTKSTFFRNRYFLWSWVSFKRATIAGLKHSSLKSSAFNTAKGLLPAFKSFVTLSITPKRTAKYNAVLFR